jgi:hypothetical protein
VLARRPAGRGRARRGAARKTKTSSSQPTNFERAATSCIAASQHCNIATCSSAASQRCNMQVERSLALFALASSVGVTYSAGERFRPPAPHGLSGAGPLSLVGTAAPFAYSGTPPRSAVGGRRPRRSLGCVLPLQTSRSSSRRSCSARGWCRTGSPRPCLQQDRAPAPPTPRLGAPPIAARKGLAAPLLRLDWDWAHPIHVCAGTGLPPATSASGPGSPRPRLRRDWGV